MPSAAPTFPPTFHPTAVCGEDVLDAWALATSFEDGWGEWSGGETYDSSDGWSCDGFDRCWSRARESNADGDATGATAPSDGSWWAFVESSNDGWQSADPDDSHPSKRFILRSPPFPASLGDGSGLLWPPSCELALAFDYAMYGADVGELSLVATGCFDDDAADCSDCFDATACALTCGACGDADAETTLWSASGDQGDAWFSTLVEVPTCAGNNRWNGPVQQNFKPLELGQIEVDSADFWTNRLLSSSSRSTAEDAGPNRSIEVRLKI